MIPRLWSSNHAANYMNFTNPLKFEILDRYKNEQVIVESVNEFLNRELQGEVDGDDYNEFFRSLGPYLNISKPTLFDNLSFLFSHNINYIYWRYLMWNFAFRQNIIKS